MTEFIHPRPRPKRTHGATESAPTKCGKLYLTSNWDETEELLECFINTGSDGGCSTNLQMGSRLISLYLRAGGDPWDVVDQIRNLRCPSSNPDRSRTSCPRAVAILLEKTLEELGHARSTDKVAPTDKSSNCENCTNCSHDDAPVEVTTEIKTEPKDDYVPVWKRAQIGVSRGTGVEPKAVQTNNNKVPCPECGMALIHQEGCVLCPSCSYSKCD